MPLSWTNPLYDYNSFIFSFDLRRKNNYNLLPLDAAVKTVYFITENYPKPYTLYLSGGIDSQAMLYAWHLSNVSFNTYSAIYNDNINFYDLEHLKQFASNLNLSINFVNFDLYSFLENEHDFYARTYYTGSPHYTTFLKMLENQKEGTAIMSGNSYRPSTYYYDQKNGTNYKSLRYSPGFEKNNLSLLHYANIKNKNFVPFFFMETEYLTHSFTVAPNKQIEESHHKCLKYNNGIDQDKFNNALYENKVCYYQYNGFPVLPQTNPKKGKYNGFEKVKDYYDKILEEKLTTLTGEELNKFKKEYSKLKLARIHGQYSTRYFDLRFRNIYETYISHHKLSIRTE